MLLEFGLVVRATTAINAPHHISIFLGLAATYSYRWLRVQHTHVDDGGAQRFGAPTGDPMRRGYTDRLEYFCRAFVAGDARGHRVGVVTRVDATEGVEYPVSVDTEDALPTDMMVKRVGDQFGNKFSPEATKWRKLRTFHLTSGSFSAPSRSSALNMALQGAVQTSIEATYEALRHMREEIVSESSHSGRSSLEEPEPDLVFLPRFSATDLDVTEATDLQSPTTPTKQSSQREEISKRSSLSQIINLVSSDDEAAMNDTTTISDDKVAEALAYAKTVPTRYKRHKMRHHRKSRVVDWHQPISRVRRNLAKCAITRSGIQIYHAKTLKAVQIQSFLRKLGVRARLICLRARRESFPTPTAKPSAPTLTEVPWPTEIKRIDTCITNGVKFQDIGGVHKCGCTVDCFVDDNLDVGDVLGEYCGELTEFPAIVEGQAKQAVKQNSGYTLLYNAKSKTRKYVYVDALHCGSITRFISHACDPNAAFVEQQNRSRVKVMVTMTKDVQAGAEITVNYGDERWFKCACEDCWQANAEQEE
ncbi:hypothetical protein F443_07045 [Phytophthora nicotianae P1569]|uniref:SET domain-containing protein n=1 Tax=Phytophthora nicotianae P1569 TaxID=1317065 RepID=V9FC92_PHYNI|nr:hypothetical protein F443_07045 [Phytophthora nicotianae P1569]